MKKVRFLLLTASVLLVLLALFSCGNPSNDDADPPCEISSSEELFGKIDAVMSALESYEERGNMNMTVYMQEHQINASGEIINIFADKVDDDKYFYSKSTTETSCEALKLDQSAMEIKAYHMGNAFYLNSLNSDIQKFYSPLSYEDFIEFYSYNSTLTIEDDRIFNCADSSFHQNDNGSWEMCLSGYPKDFVDDYAKIMGLNGEVFDDKLADLEITIKASSAFYATQVSFKMIFEDDNDATTNPTGEFISYYSAYNEATPITNILDTENYKQVPDVRLLDGFDHMIEQLQQSEEGAFKLDITQDYGFDIVITESDVVSFGRDGGYYYDINANVGDIESTITYRDGKQTVTANGSSETVDKTDDEAQDFINGLINSAMYNIFNVKQIEKTEDGRYKVTAFADEAFCRSVTSSLGVHFVSSSQTIYFAIEDMKITKIDSAIDIRYSLSSNNISVSRYIHIYSVVDFG